MITRSVATVDSLQERTWQEELAASIRDPETLWQLLELDPKLLDAAYLAANDFPMRVPQPYLERIRKGDINDPLLRQVLPLKNELVAALALGYTKDPLNENCSNPAMGLIHKYHGRVLLIVNPNCAINCRYCFRRHFPYQENKPGRSEWQQALEYIASDTSITEVIYSGGDPLAASDKQLMWLTEQIAAIPHIQRLRVHTRLPVVIPSRITGHCLQWLTGTRLKPVVVIHCNHFNELDEHVVAAMKLLKKAGITLLNQTVLLKGVNDSSDALCQLSERLFESDVLPYYLHLLDKVEGAAHFEVDDQRAKILHAELLARLPGYLVPKLVREVADQPHKLPVV